MHVAGTDLICAQLHSPAELSIQNSKGNVVGMVNGEGRSDFPIGAHDKEKKFAKLFFPEKDIKFRVDATGNGTYGPDITIKKGDHSLLFKASEIPIIPHETHTFTIDEEILKKGADGVTVQIDTNGDGIIEKI